MDFESLWVASMIAIWAFAIYVIYWVSSYMESENGKHSNLVRILGGLLLTYNVIGFYAFYTIR